MQGSTTGRRTGIVFPVLMMTVGVAWLLTVWHVDPRIQWIPVLAMFVLGVLTLLLGAVDKVTAVVGPLLVATAVFAVLRQTGRITVDVELPCLLIVAGFLMLVAHLAPIPTPKWLIEGPHRK